MVPSRVIRKLDFVAVTSRPSLQLLPAEEAALNFLLPISADYPELDQWFRCKIVPGLRLGTRKLLPIERHGTIAALGIAKKEDFEFKICTVRVSPEYVGHGMGVRVFEGLLRWLDVDQPHLTVSEGKLPAFQRIFDYFGFKMTSAQLGRYRAGILEYSYNEQLLPSSLPRKST